MILVEKFTWTLVVLLADILNTFLLDTLLYSCHRHDRTLDLVGDHIALFDRHETTAKQSADYHQLSEAKIRHQLRASTSFILFADAKGVAGLGKAGGDGTGGSDKAGQQVPPEVYSALTYAGTAFLFTLSVPLILYGLNKLLNKIEDCFGCGPSSRKEKQNKAKQLQIQNHQSQDQQQQQQQLQQPQQQQQKLQQSKLESLLSATNNGNFSLLVTSQQPNLFTSAPPSSTTITLPFDAGLNYKAPTSLPQPYIIS